MKLNWRRAVSATVLAGVLVTTGVACSQNRVASTEWGCLYGGGFTEKKELKKTIAPGESGGFTSGDDLNIVPSDTRSYTIDADPAVADWGATPIMLPVQAREVVVDGETVESEGITNIALELQARMKFNENVCQWYNDYGKNAEPLGFNVAEGQQSNWAILLKNSFYRRIREAARPIVAQYDWLELTNNRPVEYDGKEVPVYDVLAAEISKALSTELAQGLGGSFWCGPTYKFDGNVDGKLTECPAIEVAIEQLQPEDTSLLQNYQAIVANAEAQQKIQSDRDRAIAEADAKSETEVAQAEASRAAQVAEENRRREVELAAAQADLDIANAQNAVKEAERANAVIQAQADSAYCAALAAVGQSCVLEKAAENGGLPQVIGGDGLSILVQPELAE